MYLVAQRVVSREGEEGINSFIYTHHNYTWEGAPPSNFTVSPPDETLLDSDISVRPAGNRVRSYLDIVAPDLTSTLVLKVTMAQVMHLPVRQWPTSLLVGHALVRFDMDPLLRLNWKVELKALFDAGMAVRRRTHIGS